MNIKRFITTLLLIILLAFMTAFGSSIPLGPYYNDTYFDLSSNALILKVVPHEKGGLEADVSAYDGLIKIIGGATSNLTIGIADDNILEIDDADAAVDDYCKLTANGIVGRSYTEVKTDLSLNYVENLKVKLDGTTAPGVSNDNTEGYAVGSRWIDVTNDKEYVALDVSTGAAVWTETTGAGGGYTNLTSFVEQTAWRVFYSNTDGDVIELPLGADGTYLGSNGAAVAPTFSVPAGGGDVLKVGTPADSQIGVWTGDGTIEGAASLTYDGANLQLTGDIGSTGAKITKGWFTDMTVANAIAGDITGNAATVTGFTPASGSLTLSGADALTLTTTAATDVTLPTTGTLLANLLEDTTPAYGGPMDHNNQRDTEVKTVEFNGLYDCGNSGATPTVNWQNGNYQKIAVSENTLFTFSNAFIGTITLQITFSGAFTAGFNAGYTILEEGGTEVTFTGTNGAVDILKVMYLGTANNYVVGLMADVKD
ncbi:hypothetical protein KAX02_00715 [candidate division WOR-3 bacterium]|nr:hypothetical protein [candidate division WOR-3 bacterium]